MKTETFPVLVIGCGPIGLSSALLLSRFGIKSLLVERRSELNTHPRSRFVDTNTMELMREFGIEKEVEQTGLGPDWTHQNVWIEGLTRPTIAAIPSPTFYTVPRDTTPCLPVMTVQDCVEQELMKVAEKDPNIDIRFLTNVNCLTQDDTRISADLENLDTGETYKVEADYCIGADGPGSSTRAVIDAKLEADPRPVNSQDIIFNADLEKYVGDRKGSLIYCFNEAGVLIFQPLDGVQRWRCQMVIPTDEMYSEDQTKERILAAIATDEPVDIEITSMRLWQPTPGSTTTFGKGRIFLAGDAAHVFVPTGGMGNNSGFTGARNLAWKIAYVLKGLVDPEILETYTEEHKPVADMRIAVGVDTFERMLHIFRAYNEKKDASYAAYETRQYGQYEGVVMAAEFTSDLVVNDGEPPLVTNWITDYVPAIRGGRRAAHIWVDEEKTTSILDWYGKDYVLVAGPEVDITRWQEAVNTMNDKGLPVTLRQIPSTVTFTPYERNGLVLVRPDGVVADHWFDADAADPSSRMSEKLPFIALKGAA